MGIKTSVVSSSPLSFLVISTRTVQVAVIRSTVNLWPWCSGLVLQALWARVSPRVKVVISRQGTRDTVSASLNVRAKVPRVNSAMTKKFRIMTPAT